MEVDDEVYTCECCGDPVPGYKPQYCCSGFLCGCYGLPIEPCICSSFCWDKMMDKRTGESDGSK